MQLNDKDIRNIIEEVVKRYLSSSENSEVKDTPVISRAEERDGNRLELIDEGQAQKGTRSDEVIIAVAPAFGIYQTETITHIPPVSYTHLNQSSFEVSFFIQIINCFKIF